MNSDPAGTRCWPVGVATGVGSLPGSDFATALSLVLDELSDFPHLPELPARGLWAALTGRGIARLVDLGAELGARGWRLTGRPGGDQRRAAGLFAADLDAVEALAGSTATAFKLQLPGPWTLAATVELPRGERVLADRGAVRDLTDSLAAGVAELLAEAGRRVPRASLVLQLDEPALPAVRSGRIPTASGMSRLPAVADPELTAGLATVIAAVRGAGALAVLHCCAPDFPGRVVPAGTAWSLDLTAAGHDEDALGEFLDAGGQLFAGVVPALDPAVEPSARSVADLVRDLWHRLELPIENLPGQVTCTPTCGLAGASPDWARAAMRLAGQVAREVADSPEPAR